MLCNNECLFIYICEELIVEFEKVATYTKIKKYVNEQNVAAILQLMKVSCIYQTIETKAVSTVRDVKDLYLLSLADTVKADYILTGDKDLLTLHNHRETKIVTFSEFITLLETGL
jgi:putative PIN family toxin of toxin-antitoxin system